MKFLCDAMLGKLARWLRILGYDCELAPDGASDNEVICLAEGRILLTRDRHLADVPRSVCFAAEDLESQLRALSRKFPLRKRLTPTRCPLCNGALAAEGERWRCQKCNQHYWRGSHWDRINAFLEKASTSGGRHRLPGRRRPRAAWRASAQACPCPRHRRALRRLS